MKESDVYSHEEEVLNKAEEVENDAALSFETLLSGFKELLKEYGKLLRKIRKITRVGDSNQRKLLAAYDKIENQNLELERARKEADRANNAKSEFLAKMSHEIRTPMNAILGMTELALAASRDEEQQDYLETVKEAGGNLLTVINDILEFSRVEAGKVVLEHVDFNLEAVLKATVKMFSIDAAKKGLALNLDIDSRVPLILKGDYARLRQVIVNLVGNAVKFTSKGSITIAVHPAGSMEQVHEQEAGVRLAFSVRDTGLGIPQRQQAHIFESFSQADSSTTRRYGGTGLGLSICKQLVELMEGSITLESKAGEGSVFRFTAVFAAGDPEAVAQAAQPVPDHPIGKSLNILLAEDDAASAKLALIFLARQGHRIVRVANGREALEQLRTKPFDAVLMDLEMPEMDGYQAVRRIRADARGDFDPAIPVIALTAHSLPEVREKIVSCGMSGMITKPVDFYRLSRVLAGLSVQTGPVSVPAETADMEKVRARQPRKKEQRLYRTFNKKAALMRMDGDKELFARFCDMVRRELPVNKTKLREAFDKKDFETLRKHAHYVKGSVASIGAEALSHQAALLEKSAREKKNTAKASRLLQRVDEEIERLKSALEHADSI
jgi:signal transduction histidine kinase/DNA-binding NarL/FixJ family response regulator